MNLTNHLFFLSRAVVSLISDLISNVYTPSELRFLLFVSIWSFFIAVPYLVIVPIYLPRFAHIYALLAMEALVTIFWFAGFVALAANLPPAKFCDSKYNNGFCGELQAATVFGAFTLSVFSLLSFLLSLLLCPFFFFRFFRPM